MDFGIDLDQLGERILQAARDGDGAAHGEIEIGKLLTSHIRGRVDGCAGFVHGHAENVGQFRFAQESCTNASVSREPVPLPMAMARTLYLWMSA